MANVKKGNAAPPPQWWKHLRDWKRVFWKRERRSQDELIKRSVESSQTRVGWAEASERISKAGDDKLAWPEFSNKGDKDIKW